MATFVPDINTLYTLQSVASDFHLGYNTTNVAYPYPLFANSLGSFWQWADYGELTGTDATGTYLVRANNDASYCMDLASGSLPVYDYCSTSTVLWQFTASEASENSFYITPVGSTLYLGTTDDADPAPAALYDSYMTDDVQWSFSSIGVLSGTVWSTLPFSTTTSMPATSSTSASQTLSSSTTSSASSLSSAVTSMMSSSSPSSRTSHTTISASSTSATASSSTSIPTSNFDISIPLGESIEAWNPVAASVLPSQMKIVCTNCSMSGYLGYAVNGDDSIMDFADHGSVQLEMAGIVANMSLDIQLMQGFKLVDATIALFKTKIGSFEISDHLEVGLTAEIGIPLKIILETPVSLAGGFTYSLPGPAKIFLDVNDPTSSNVTGFDAGKIAALPFSYDDPGLTISMITGVSFKILVDVTAVDDDVSVTGNIDVDLGLPVINVTAHALSNIDSNCQPAANGATSYKYGAEVTTSAGADLSASGGVAVAYMNATAFTWPAPTLPSFEIDVEGPSACIYGDRVDGKTSNDANPGSNHASTGVPLLGKPFTTLSWALSILAAVMVML